MTTNEDNHNPENSVPLSARQRFFEQAVGLEMALQMCADLPSVFFFIKDRESRFMFVSDPFALRLGLTDADEVILTRDHDYTPPVVADRFVRDDRRVMDTGVALRNYRELLFRPCEGFVWAVTSKWPVFDFGGQVIGLAAITRNDGGPFSTDDDGGVIDSEINRLTEFIVARLGNPPTNEQMARASGLSVRSLTRKVQETYGMTPRHFATLTRIQLACQSLAETDKSLIDIALEHGFADQSSFSTQFKKIVGTTPRQFRLRWHKKVGHT